MTAGAAEPSPPLSTMSVPDVEYIVPPPGAENGLNIPSSPRAFKRHKHLPHPRHGSGSTNGSFGTPESRRSSSGSQSSHVASLHTLRHQRRQISGGELPPTPPAHSRASSSSKSISISNITPFQTPAQSSEDVQGHVSPSTPPNQRSPPTPEVTPPRPDARSRLLVPDRPTLTHRIRSKSTTTDSRTESFRTALESPEPVEEVEEDDSNPTLRPAPPSATTSQITVREVNGDESDIQNGLGLISGAASKYEDEPHDLTPRANGEFNSFDGQWGVDDEVEQQWDDNLSRNVTVKKRRHRSPDINGPGHETVDDRTVSPTNATKAVRIFPLQGRVLTYHSQDPPRSFTAPEVTNAETPARSDARRNSAMSSKSAASTVVEAILVEAPPARRNRTLRHVKRVDALRDSVWQPTLHSSVPSHEKSRRPRRVTQPNDAPRDSYASNSTVNSISSRKARKEIWKAGAIPVVVVPDRHSSTRSSSQDRSLRSVSSQRSKRSQTTSSVPLSQVPKTQDLTPDFDRPPRRDRRTSESDGSAPGDQRTMDFPPIVPRRTSSLSAPTSRNGSRRASLDGSRAGSLTAESLKVHNDSVIANGTTRASSHATARAPSSRTETSAPAVTISSAPSYFQFKPGEPQMEGGGHHKHRTLDSQLGSPLLPTQTTPFSQISVETSGTAAEISQAMAVSIDRHQNRSVLMVDHRPSESSDGETRNPVPGMPDRPSVATAEANGPTITTTEFSSPDDEPITPPQMQPPFSLNDIESPLRNPRVPPEPPVLQFIPATPSGLTPADERPRLLGNFYDELEHEKPPRGLAMVRRALSKRRNSYGPSTSHQRPGFLFRTLSLSKNIRKETAENPEIDDNDHGTYDEPPRDESRLHPDWRPSYYPDFYEGSRNGVYEMRDDEEGDEWRYPMIDNRPRPRRTLSDRMKRTFAIMPVRSYNDEYMQDHEPERRTIRRDPSGNLRVVKHRGSVGSLRDRKRRAETAPEPQRTPIFPRKYSLAKLRRRDSEDSETESQRLGLRRTWSLTQGMQGLSRRVSERRREKRSDELRKKISAPRDCRDGVEDVIRREGLRGDYRTARTAEDERMWM